MSKAAVKISVDLLSNPLCEQDQAFLEAMSALDTAMKRMDSFNQEKVRLSPKFDIVLVYLIVEFIFLFIFTSSFVKGKMCMATWQKKQDFQRIYQYLLKRLKRTT